MEGNATPKEGRNKKIIVVRKAVNTVTTAEHGENLEVNNIYPGCSTYDDQQVPLAFKDSVFVGLGVNKSNVKKVGETENKEIQVIDPNAKGKAPLVALFPELEKDDNAEDIASGQMDTDDVTKKLVGKTPDFSYLKRSPRTNLLEKKSCPSLPNIQEEGDFCSGVISVPSDENAPKPSSPSLPNIKEENESPQDYILSKPSNESLPGTSQPKKAKKNK